MYMYVTSNVWHKMSIDIKLQNNKRSEDVQARYDMSWKIQNEFHNTDKKFSA